MNQIVITYLFYLPVALALTFFVARTFFQNSKVFMLDIFRGREEIALSTNKLFEVGFYLLNLGFALYFMKIDYQYDLTTFGKQLMFETLSFKIGTLAVFLGLMVFLNLYLLFRGKKKSKQNQQNELSTS